MIDWAARLKTVFSHERQNSTAITDETPLSSVSSVPDGRAYGKHDGVSSVSSVPDGHLYEKLIEAINRCCDVRGDDDRNRDGLIAEAADYATEAQLDLIEHFDEQAAIWRRVTGAAS